jgi:hypothetical protein
MALRTPLGCLAVALAVWVGAGCKDKGSESKPQAGDLNRRCEQLGMTCGDKDKHTEKMVDECSQAAKKHTEKGCSTQAMAVYDCYEKELCGKSEKIWTVNDLPVLAERHGKCTAERTALRDCMGK